MVQALDISNFEFRQIIKSIKIKMLGIVQHLPSLTRVRYHELHQTRGFKPDAYPNNLSFKYLHHQVAEIQGLENLSSWQNLNFFLKLLIFFIKHDKYWSPDIAVFLAEKLFKSMGSEEAVSTGRAKSFLLFAFASVIIS